MSRLLCEDSGGLQGLAVEILVGVMMFPLGSGACFGGRLEQNNTMNQLLGWNNAMSQLLG